MHWNHLENFLKSFWHFMNILQRYGILLNICYFSWKFWNFNLSVDPLKKKFNQFYGSIQESRIQAITEQSSIQFTELFRTKYWTLKFFHESFVFWLEKFRKFYRTLFCNRLYPWLLNSSIKFIKLFFFSDYPSVHPSNSSSVCPSDYF